MMAMLYASKICMEAKNPKTGKPWEFADVPPKLKAQVRPARTRAGRVRRHGGVTLRGRDGWNTRSNMTA